MARQDGEIWVRKPLETLQYHINGKTKTVYPEAFYTALSTDIVHGSVVSIEDGGVNLTDSTTHKKAIGFARIGDGYYDPELLPTGYTIEVGVTEIEIQTYGQIVIPFSQFTSDLTSADIGKGVYVATSSQYNYKRGSEKLGAVTVERSEAASYNGSIIECGTVSAVNTGDSEVTIDVDLGGDSLGPAGTTEVEYTSNQLIGIRNTPRVFSYVANEIAKEHDERLNIHLADAFSLDTLEGYWIAMDMFFGNPEGKENTQKKTLVFYFTAETDGPTLSALATSIIENGLGDASTPATFPSINGGGKFKMGSTAGIAFVTIPTPGASARKTLMDNLIDAANGKFATLFDYSGTEDDRLLITIDDGTNTYSTTDGASTLTDVEDYTIQFETVAATIVDDEDGGVVNLYYNPLLKEAIVMNHSIVTYGELASGAGVYRIVPADRRRYVDSEMSDTPKLVTVVGALSSPLPADPSTYVYRGQQVLLKKMGIVGGFSNLTPGLKVYLGYNGHVTQVPAEIEYDEFVVELGVAKSATEIDLMIADPRLKETTRDPLPVGIILDKAEVPGSPGTYVDASPGFIDTDGSIVDGLEYPDLYYALMGTAPTPGDSDLTIPTVVGGQIKAFSFSLYPDSATPELPVSARRHETDWKILSGDGIDAGAASFIELNHKLKASVRDVIGYMIIGVTDATGVIGEIATPIPGANQAIIYPGFSSDSVDNVYGWQLEEDSLTSLVVRVGDSGVRVINPSTGSFVNVASANASLIDASATHFVYKVVLYKIEHIYDFKDDSLIEKANDYWYTHRLKYYSNNTDVVHGVTASDVAGAGTLCRRSASDEIEASSFNATSKREFKENIIPFEEKALDIINTTDIFKFNFKVDEWKKLKIGFMADDTHEYLATENHDKVDMYNTLGVLIKAVQELNAEIDYLKKPFWKKLFKGNK